MKRLIVAGILVLAVVLLATFPARVAYQWLAPPELQLSGISGSIWNGHATEGLAADVYLTDIHWRFRPASLFRGNLTYEAAAKPVGGSLMTDVSVATDGSIILTDLSGGVPLDLVLPQFQAQGISGDLSLAFDRLVLRNGIPVAATGSVTVVDLFAPYLSAGVLGDFQLVFATTPDGISATLDDLAGVLDVSGNVDLSPDRHYRVQGLVKARPAAPPSVEAQLRVLGSPDDNGMRYFATEGVL
jgi:general secretion pathway protein N